MDFGTAYPPGWGLLKYLIYMESYDKKTGPGRRLRRVPSPAAGFLGVLLCLAPAAVRAAETSLEYAVKANFLYKFAAFVTWPQDTMAPGSPAWLCLAGGDPFGGGLDETVRGQSIGTHPIAVVRLHGVTSDSTCHILYVRGPITRDVLKTVAGRPILTITDQAGTDGVGGGVINFILKDNRVRFEIDERIAAANGLGISSKLLGLAVAVRPR